MLLQKKLVSHLVSEKPKKLFKMTFLEHNVEGQTDICIWNNFSCVNVFVRGHIYEYYQQFHPNYRHHHGPLLPVWCP